MPTNKEFILKRKSYNPLTDNLAGYVIFDNTTHKIYVGGDCYSSDVKNVSFNSSLGILTITKMDNLTITLDLNAMEREVNKVTSISSSATNDEYPSAKYIYELSKDKGEVVWEVQSVVSGILASETNISATPNWQITNLDMSEYQNVKLYVRSGGTGSNTTASAVITINLGALNKSPFGHFIGSTVIQNPNNRNHLTALTAVVSEDKTSIFFNRTTDLYGTVATNANTDGRVLYKIVGYRSNTGHAFQIISPGEYTGKNLFLRAEYDGTIVTPTWSIVVGQQYAVINQWGRVDIIPGASSDFIVIQAEYGSFTEQKFIEISYDNQLVIYCPDTITGTSGSVVALYNNNECTPVWSITSGNENATINEYGEITIIQSGGITIQAVYNGYTTTKIVTLDYQPNTTQETIINPDGSVTEITTTEIMDPSTGTSTTETTSTTMNMDGFTSQTNTETIENQDGSSTSTSTTTNSDGTSSETESTTSAPDSTTRVVTTESNTINYDENGDISGSSDNTTVENQDGSSASITNNYNDTGDPTITINQSMDTQGNQSTQNIDYDEEGNPTVTGYDINTSDGTTGEKTFNTDGVNTQFYGFDTTDGFKAHIHFTIDFDHQPANQDENHHNILTMKRTALEPWYGFQLRQSNNTKSIIIGTQFATGSNTNTTIIPPRYVTTNVGEYDIEILYDPTATGNKFIARDLIGDTIIYQSTGEFPDIQELRYLTVCIGYAMDANGNPYRYSNINVSEFEIIKLSKVLEEPVITCDGSTVTITCETVGADIYYRLNQLGSFSLYTTPITISADTFIEAYSETPNNISDLVSMNCITTND